MNQKPSLAPEAWRAALAESDLEIARGDLVPAQSIHDELRRLWAEGIACGPGQPADIADIKQKARRKLAARFTPAEE